MTEIYEERFSRRLGAPISLDTMIGEDVVLGFGVVIEENVLVGNNVLIESYSIIRPGVIIGDNTEIRPFCFIAEGARIGRKVKIFQYVNICKDAIIEDCVYIGPKTILTNTRKIAHLRKYRPEIDPPKICYGARIGTNVTILPGITIGRNALVGAGSVVTKDIPDLAVAIGSPARIVGEVLPGERI